jgi:hypothetical protein
MHDSPRTIPESRRTEHDYYALIESGIGSTLEDVDRHFQTMAGLVGSTDVATQMNALNNARYLFDNLLAKEYAPRSLAFCCLLESINGERWLDYSPDGLNALIERLSSLGVGTDVMLDIWLDLKKKIYSELNEAFPDHFSDGVREQESLQARIMILELDELIDPENPTLDDRRRSINREIQETIKPPILTGKKNQLDQIRKNYVDNKIALQLEGLPVDDQTPALQFWEYLIALDARYRRKNKPTHESAE